MQNRMIAELDPAAIIPDQDLIGDDGVVEVRDFDTDSEEAKALAKRIQSWLDEGVGRAMLQF